jgi:glycosyltransferase involved in cell wall biosynthesis
MPEFSVVIPAYNARSTIRSAISSALAQSERDLEVVVVDDGSTDGTAGCVEAESDRRVSLIRQANRGLPAARNAGIAVARGRYITLLDSDDMLLPTYLERCGAALRENPGAAFAYTDAYVVDDRTGRVRQRTAMQRHAPAGPPPADRDGLLLALIEVNFVFVAVTLEAGAISDVGGFDESRRSAEDWDLWLRLLIAGYEGIWISPPQAVYRKHDSQMSRRMRTMNEAILSVYRDIPLEALPSAAHRQMVLRRQREYQWRIRALALADRLVPQRLIGALKRAGVSESWYDKPPPELASTLELMGSFAAADT